MNSIKDPIEKFASFKCNAFEVNFTILKNIHNKIIENPLIKWKYAHTFSLFLTLPFRNTFSFCILIQSSLAGTPHNLSFGRSAFSRFWCQCGFTGIVLTSSLYKSDSFISLAFYNCCNMTTNYFKPFIVIKYFKQSRKVIISKI